MYILCPFANVRNESRGGLGVAGAYLLVFQSSRALIIYLEQALDRSILRNPRESEIQRQARDRDLR